MGNVHPLASKQRTVKMLNKELDELKAEIRAAANVVAKMYNAINMFKNEFNDFRDKIDPPKAKEEPATELPKESE